MKFHIPGRRVSRSYGLDFVARHGGVMVRRGFASQRWFCDGDILVSVGGDYAMVCQKPLEGFHDDEVNDSSLCGAGFPQLAELESQKILGMMRADDRVEGVGDFLDAWIDGEEIVDALGVHDEAFSQACSAVGIVAMQKMDGVWGADPWCQSDVWAVWVPHGVLRVGHLVWGILGCGKPSGAPISGRFLGGVLARALSELAVPAALKMAP